MVEDQFVQDISRWPHAKRGISVQDAIAFCNGYYNGMAYSYIGIVDCFKVCHDLDIPNNDIEPGESFFETRPIIWVPERWYMWHGDRGYFWACTDTFLGLVVCGPTGSLVRKLCSIPRRLRSVPVRIVWKKEYANILVVFLPKDGKAPEILKTDMPTSKEGLDKEREEQPHRWKILSGYDEEPYEEDALFFDI
ncbi:hypothetical protein K440DRAFT_622530 [Wilcoxina mikolae CBS 423.85]|nr:hypothetical protein K440DRAFT_622530 [Wilcoxina mikolae CBS 423.85]